MFHSNFPFTVNEINLIMQRLVEVKTCKRCKRWYHDLPPLPPWYQPTSQGGGGRFGADKILAELLMYSLWMEKGKESQNLARKFAIYIWDELFLNLLHPLTWPLLKCWNRDRLNSSHKYHITLEWSKVLQNSKYVNRADSFSEIPNNAAGEGNKEFFSFSELQRFFVDMNSN